MIWPRLLRPCRRANSVMTSFKCHRGRGPLMCRRTVRLCVTLARLLSHTIAQTRTRASGRRPLSCFLLWWRYPHPNLGVWRAWVGGQWLQLGFECMAIDVVEAPDDIKAVLCDSFSFHTIVRCALCSTTHAREPYTER
jgi:hypothetical protein